MSSEESKFVQHFVCTHDQAREFIKGYDTFFIGTCGCRDGNGPCKRSQHDVCLSFSTEWDATKRRDSSKEEALKLVDLAAEKGLITRPFRNQEQPDKLDGICFCCPECCYYFQKHEEECDKGTLCEATDRAECSDCGACVDSCHFGARELVGGKLVIDRDKCYGCGLCVDACPMACISMK